MEDDIQTMEWKTRNPENGVEYAQKMAKGEFNHRLDAWQADLVTLRSMDIGNFLNPVPAKVYYDARTDECWGMQTHCGTITDDSYRPNIYIKEKAWYSAMPSQYTCGMSVLKDPPRAITTIDLHGRSLDEPVFPARATEAVPGSPPLQTLSTPTAAADSEPLFAAEENNNNGDQAGVGPAGRGASSPRPHSGNSNEDIDNIFGVDIDRPGRIGGNNAAPQIGIVGTDMNGHPSPVVGSHTGQQNEEGNLANPTRGYTGRDRPPGSKTTSFVNDTPAIERGPNQETDTKKKSESHIARPSLLSVSSIFVSGLFIVTALL
jgi:hypothetical protein